MLENVCWCNGSMDDVDNEGGNRRARKGRGFLYDSGGRMAEMRQDEMKVAQSTRNIVHDALFIRYEPHSSLRSTFLLQATLTALSSASIATAAWKTCPSACNAPTCTSTK